MSILDWLGLTGGATTPSESLVEIEKALTGLDPKVAQFLAGFAYILGRVARADHEISDAESEAMIDLVGEHGQLPAHQAALVVRIAQSEGLRHGGTEDFIVTRRFAEIADRRQKLLLLDCLFAVSAADRSIRAVEDNEIRQIASELRLEHADFIAARARHRRDIEVLKRPTDPSN